jgi:hypothetical protein
MAILAVGLASGSSGPEDSIGFARDVLPILSEHCYHCHGPDAGTREADLRLDLYDDVLFVAEPGDVDASPLLDRIVHSNPKRLMPPPEFGKPLSTDQVEVLRRWVEEGLAWESHWAFEPIPDASEVELTPDGWGLDPLDSFVSTEHARAGVAPADPASHGTWLRRVSLDLIGLPPSVAELDAFLAEAQAAADRGEIQALRAQTVDRLLQSDHRAEHRARQWLDVARYADTNGYQNDFGRDQWPWRDWVVRAFAVNMPYDQFVREQVAGDLLPDASQESILATGFQRNHRMVTEAGSIDEEWRVENVADRVETTATTFLGLTLACARCHDHKYDALSQEDYYRFYGFFNSIDEKGVYEETRGNVPPIVHVHSEGDEARLASLRAAEADATEDLKAARTAALAGWAGWRGAGAVESLADVPEDPWAKAGPFQLTSETPSSQRTALGAEVIFSEEKPFSVSVWVKPMGHGAIYSRMSDDDTYRGTDLILADSMRPAVHLIHSWPKRAIKVVGKRALERGLWHHVTVTYDGSMKAAGVSILLNGEPLELDVEADSLDGPITSDAPLILGWRRYAGDLVGTVSDLRVDASQLSPAQSRAVALDRTRRDDGAEFYADAVDPAVQAAVLVRSDARRARVHFETDGVPTAMVLRDREEPRATFLLNRGSYDRPTGEPLRPDVPAIFGGLSSEAPHDRLGLADWLVDTGNPLTARVAVNRVWASFFGRGLVATQDDFGVRGERPTHGGLLDYLSAEFMASGWDLRALERRIALSATYAQSSSPQEEAREMDPQNLLLARFPRLRLDAEVIRDSALQASGLLVQRMGGPPVKPYQPDGLWAELAGGAGQGAYVPSEGDDLFRRSLYTYRKRTVPHPTLTTFDAPGFELCTVARSRTNTPLQALATLNDPTYVEAARHLAARMMGASGEAAERLAFAAGVVLSREFDPRETEVLTAALKRHSASFEEDPAAADALLGVGASAPPREQRTSEWAAYTMIASTLLNLDEALTKP